jgi:hypothetical protein
MRKLDADYPICPTCGEQGDEIARGVFVMHGACERKLAAQRVVLEIERHEAQERARRLIVEYAGRSGNDVVEGCALAVAIRADRVLKQIFPDHDHAALVDLCTDTIRMYREHRRGTRG